MSVSLVFCHTTYPVPAKLKGDIDKAYYEAPRNNGSKKIVEYFFTLGKPRQINKQGKNISYKKVINNHNFILYL